MPGHSPHEASKHAPDHAVSLGETPYLSKRFDVGVAPGLAHEPAQRSLLDPWFGPSRIAVSDPFGTHHYWVDARYSPLSPYYELDATTTYDKLWYGKYIVLVPRA